MTGLVDQGQQIWISQHHDAAYSIGSRSAQWSARVVGSGVYGEQIFENVGDHVGMRWWPANIGGGQVITGGSGSSESRELDAWSPVFAATALGAGKTPGADGYTGTPSGGGGGGGGGGAAGGVNGKDFQPLPGGGGGGAVGVGGGDGGLKWDPNRAVRTTGYRRVGSGAATTNVYSGQRDSFSRFSGTTNVYSGQRDSFSRFYQPGASRSGKGRNAGDVGAWFGFGPRPGEDEGVEGRSLPPRFVAHLPVRDTTGKADKRFRIASSLIPPEDSGVPMGTPGIALAGTEERSQENLYIPIQRRVIVPGNAGSIDMGTLFCDLSPANVIAKGIPPGVGGRQALAQSMERIVRMPTKVKGISLSQGNTRAWLLKAAEQGGMAGFGSCYGSVQSGGGGGGPPTTPSGGPGGGGGGSGTATIARDSGRNGILDIMRNNARVLGERSKGGIETRAQSLFGVDTRFSGSDRVPPGAVGARPAPGGGRGGGGGDAAVGFASVDAGGPFSCGYAKDKHQLGKTRDKEVINPIHLPTNVLFERNEEEDAPLEFTTLPFLQGLVYDEISAVFLSYDPKSSHSGPYGTQSGLWRWWTTVPHMDDPGKPPPPTPRPPVTPGPEPREPGEPAIPPVPGRPVTPGSQPLGPGGPLPGTSRSFVRPTIEVRSAPGSFADGKDRHIMYQRMVGFSGFFVRPQSTYKNAVDFRYTTGISGEDRWGDLARRPATMRAEGFGQEAGGAFVYNQRPEYSRVPGGTSLVGGLAFMPAEFDIVDYRDDSSPPSGVGTGTSYVVAAPGVWFAAGNPSMTQGVQNGGVRWGWDAGSSEFAIAANVSGVWTKAIEVNGSGHLGFYGTGAVAQPADPGDASESHSVTGGDTVDQTAVEAALNQLGTDYNALKNDVIKVLGLIT